MSTEALDKVLNDGDAANAGPTLADDLDDAWDSMTAASDAEAGEPSADDPSNDEQTTSAAQPSDEDSGKLDGDLEDTGAEDDPTDPPEPSGEAQTDDVPNDDDAPIEAPAHWPADDRETFDELPAKGQEFLLRRHHEMEADYTRKTQELAPLRKAYEPIKAMAERAGLSEAEGVQRLVAAQQSLDRDPIAALQWIANGYIQNAEQAQTVINAIAGKHGITLGEQRNTQDFDGQDDVLDVDPQVARLNQQVTQLTARVTQTEEQAANEQRQQAQAAVDAFRDTKDESGNPKYPHFDQVRDTMGALLVNGIAADMADAYQRAVRADPNLYQQQTDASAEEAKKRQQAEARKRAADAKRKTLPRSSRKGTTAPQPETTADELSEVWDKLSGAAA